LPGGIAVDRGGWSGAALCYETLGVGIRRDLGAIDPERLSKRDLVGGTFMRHNLFGEKTLEVGAHHEDTRRHADHVVGYIRTGIAIAVASRVDIASRVAIAIAIASRVAILSWWSFAFRNGFYGFTLPVYFRCFPDKPNNANHNELNVIELRRGFWDTAAYDASQAMTILHEMGHWSQNKFLWTWPAGTAGSIWGGAFTHSFPNFLDDKKNSNNCSGGVGDNNKCYRDVKWLGIWQWENVYQRLGGPPFIGDNFNFGIPDGFGFYVGDEPRSLVQSFENGSVAAFNDMLYNIDNYVCYMWHRWLVHGYCRLNFL
jgi:hypothetical protein